MRLRWLLLAVLTASVAPASARSRPIDEPVTSAYTIAAAIEPGAHAGKLVLAFHNPGAHTIEVPIRVVVGDAIEYDGLTVELSNATMQRTLGFVADRAKVQTTSIAPLGTVYETIDLDPYTRDLVPGAYTARVVWDGRAATTTTTVLAHCGLYYATLRGEDEPAPPARAATSPSPSRWPYALDGLALAALVGAAWLARRAGATGVRVPCSAS